MVKPSKRILRRRALVLLLSAVAGCALAEGGLRLLLFRDVSGFEDLSRSLREPGLYADMRRDGLYWQLRRIWLPGAEQPLPGEHMPATGWVSPAVDPRTLAHVDEATLGDRRPVLLYGDSYALCMTSEEFTWQALLERSPEGRTHVLVNYGTHAFGTDQALLQLESTIGRFAGRDPLVVFGIFLEEGPDRALLGCRTIPKPRSELVDGELVIHPLDETDAQRWWEKHPPDVTSYLWRMLGPRGGSAEDARVMETARAILARMHRELDAQGIEHLVLGFHSRAMMENPREHLWREEALRKACAELGLHYLCSRPYLLAVVDGRAERAGPELFLEDGLGAGHYNALGNVAVFEAFLQALRGRYAIEDTSGVKDALLRFGVDPHDEQQRDMVVVGALARLTFRGDAPARCMQEVAMPDGQSTRMLGLHPFYQRPAQLEWTIEQPARFVATLEAWRSKPGEEQNSAVRLRVLLDGRELRVFELRPREPTQPLEIELPAGSRFVLAVEPVAGSARSCWVRFARPAFR